MLELIKKWFELKFHVHDWETVEEKLKKVFENDYQSRRSVKASTFPLQGNRGVRVSYGSLLLGVPKISSQYNLKNY